MINIVEQMSVMDVLIVMFCVHSFGMCAGIIYLTIKETIQERREARKPKPRERF